MIFQFISHESLTKFVSREEDGDESVSEEEGVVSRPTYLKILMWLPGIFCRYLFHSLATLSVSDFANPFTRMEDDKGFYVKDQQWQ